MKQLDDRSLDQLQHGWTVDDVIAWAVAAMFTAVVLGICGYLAVLDEDSGVPLTHLVGDEPIQAWEEQWQQRVADAYEQGQVDAMRAVLVEPQGLELLQACLALQTATAADAAAAK